MLLHVRVEESARITEDAVISGIAAIPQVSRNEVLYLPNEIAHADGKTVPLNWMHSDPIKKIGEVKFHWDAEKLRLMYEGRVTDPTVSQMVKNRKMFVSLGADFASQEKTCDTTSCYQTPLGLNIFELSIVDTPGIPQVSLNVVESYLRESATANPSDAYSFTSLKLDSSNSKRIMEKETPQVSNEDTTTIIKKVQTDEAPKTEIECPPGQKDDGEGKCVPVAPEEQADTGCGCNKDEVIKPEETKQVPVFDAKQFESSLQKGLDSLADKIGILVKVTHIVLALAHLIIKAS